MGGFSGDPGFGVWKQCALIFWVRGSGPLLPHQMGSTRLGRLSKPLARLKQDSPGHCHRSQDPIARLARPWETVHPSLATFPVSVQLPPILFLVRRIWVQIPAPLLTSCVISDRLPNLSDFSFLVLEMEPLTPPSESWREGSGPSSPIWFLDLGCPYNGALHLPWLGGH